jgi:DNA-binding transcriptional LysR family regulator
VVLPEGHPLLERETLDLADLDGVPFAGQSAETALQKLCRGQAEARGVALNERVNVSGFDGVRRMVEAGRGVAILPATAAQPYAAAMRIGLRPLAEPGARRPLVIVSRAPETLSAAARVLIVQLNRLPG